MEISKINCDMVCSVQDEHSTTKSLILSPFHAPTRLVSPPPAASPFPVPKHPGGFLTSLVGSVLPPQAKEIGVVPLKQLLLVLVV